MLSDVHVGDRVMFHHGGWPGRNELKTVIAETPGTLTIDGGREFNRRTSYALDGALVYITAVQA